MKLQRVYLDTSALVGCFDPEFAEWSSGLMQDFRNGLFKPLLSQVTATELQDAPEKVQAVYAELLTLGVEMNEATESALELADGTKSIASCPPPSFTMMVCTLRPTVGEADVLVSWNFKHIMRFDKIRLFNAVNLEYGYKPLQIFNPREVTTYGRAEN